MRVQPLSPLSFLKKMPPVVAMVGLPAEKSNKSYTNNMPPREERWQHIKRLAAERGDNNINPMVWTGRRRVPSTAITRRYHLSRRPCPQDGITNPTASLEKKLTRLTPKRCQSCLLFFRLSSLNIRLGPHIHRPSVCMHMRQYRSAP